MYRSQKKGQDIKSRLKKFSFAKQYQHAQLNNKENLHISTFTESYNYANIATLQNKKAKQHLERKFIINVNFETKKHDAE